MNRDLALLSATDLVAGYRSGDLSPVDATEAALAQIDAHDDAVNAFCLVDHDRALDAARASEERWQAGEPLGPVDGVPTGVKDVFLTRGWPTLRGSKVVDPDQPWEIDAPVVSALKRNGAVLLGKTTTPELGWKGVTDAPPYGVTRNPWDPTKTAGGSSGGSSAAVVLGMGALALGTDGGGSIRIPAGFCGHPGVKPTYGRVPVWPASPYGTLAHAGPIARTVEDLALMLNVLSEPDSRDWTALPDDGVDYVTDLAGGVAGLRVGFSVDMGIAGGKLDPEVREAVDTAVGVFEELGADVEPVALGIEDPVDVFGVLWNSGAAAVVRGYTDEQRALMDPGLQRITEEGAGYSALDYLEAAQQRAELAIAMNRFHDEYDLLLTPTLPIPAFEAGRDVPECWPEPGGPSWTPFSYPFNLTQQPAASVPCGFTEAGLPIGLQIVGAKYADALVLRAAQAYEQACQIPERRPAMLDAGA